MNLKIKKFKKKKKFKIKSPLKKYKFLNKTINSKEDFLNLIIRNYKNPSNKLIKTITKNLNYCFFDFDYTLKQNDKEIILVNLTKKLLENYKSLTKKETKILNYKYINKKFLGIFGKNIFYSFNNELIDFIYTIYEFNRNSFSKKATKYVDLLTDHIYFFS